MGNAFLDGELGAYPRVCACLRHLCVQVYIYVYVCNNNTWLCSSWNWSFCSCRGGEAGFTRARPFNYWLRLDPQCLLIVETIKTHSQEVSPDIPIVIILYCIVVLSMCLLKSAALILYHYSNSTLKSKASGVLCNYAQISMHGPTRQLQDLNWDAWFSEPQL